MTDKLNLCTVSTWAMGYGQMGYV